MRTNPRSLTRKLAVFAALTNQSRSERFLNRRAGHDRSAAVTLADVVRLPRWVMESESVANDIAAVSALLHFRPAIDQELSGARLRAIGDVFGEGCFDLACDASLPAAHLMIDQGTELPRPDVMADHGWSILHASLPQSMATLFPGARGDDQMAELADLAATLVLESPTGPGIAA